MTNQVALNDHFFDFVNNWDYKFYFLFGGYGSSKSYHIGIKLIKKLLEEKRTALVVREVYDTIRDSCYSLLEEVAISFGLEGIVQFKSSPMMVKFPNGSKIIFKGMDKPAKLKSINGVSIIWVEECSEVKYAGYKELLGRLRHKTMSNHIILSTNPVSKGNWCYKHFFIDNANQRTVVDDTVLYKKRIIVKENTYYHHSLPDDNYFLPSSYIEELEKMKEYDQDLYRIARKGQFGVNGTKVLPQFEVMEHEKLLQEMRNIKSKVYRVGMDFGFETSYNALIRMCIDDDKKILYIYWEYYKNHMTDDRTAEEIQEFRNTQELIRADIAEPKTIAYYQQQGFNMIGAKKFAGSRLQNTKKVKRFRKIICSDICKNTIMELKDLTYATNRLDEIIEDEFNIDAHVFSSMWYGLDGYEVADLKERKYDVYDKGKGVLKSSEYKRGNTVF